MPIRPTHRSAGRPADDRGSMPLAMLLTIVGIGLSVVLAGTVSAQQRTTRVDLQRADAVNAAQSGINVALSQLRAAVDGTGSAGDRSELPCNKPTTVSTAFPQGYAFTGKVSPSRAAEYTTEIYYLAASPPAGNVAWARANKLPCTVGSGTATVPMYALIAATGRGGPEASRTLYATYTFSSTQSNPHLAGGQIRIFRFDPTDIEYCLTSLTDTPSAGDALYTRPCDDTSKRQEFAYEANLNLVLASTRSTTPRGMCLDGGSPVAAGNTVRFQPCAATTVTRQQWGENDYSAFQGTSDGVGLNDLCFNVATPNANSVIKLGQALDDNHVACYYGWDDMKTMFPDADVGTGRAGPATDQLVNNDQFGRCIDVTDDDVAFGHLIVFPCKQKPSGRIQWNQEWIIPTIPPGATSITGPIYTTCPVDWDEEPCALGKKYCLTSPGSTAAGQYVTVQICPPGPTPPEMTWTYRQDTGLYSNSYRIESTYGVTSGANHCLSPTDPDAASPDLWYTFDVPFSKLVLAKCTSSDLQKWNVSPVTVSGALKDILER